MDFTYFFTRNLTSYGELIVQTFKPEVRTCRETYADCHSYARKVMFEWVLTNQTLEGELGGDGVFDEIYGLREKHPELQLPASVLKWVYDFIDGRTALAQGMKFWTYGPVA